MLILSRIHFARRLPDGIVPCGFGDHRSRKWLMDFSANLDWIETVLYGDSDVLPGWIKGASRTRAVAKTRGKRSTFTFVHPVPRKSILQCQFIRIDIFCQYFVSSEIM